jgi:hypothetical protein
MSRPNPKSCKKRAREEQLDLGQSEGGNALGDHAVALAPQILAVDVPTAATMLGISERLCWDLVGAGSGELVSFMALGRRLVAIAEIEAYIRRQQDAERTRAA